MVTHASPEVLRGTAAIVPIRIVRDIKLQVAYGQPSYPGKATRFVLSWWEKGPPESVRRLASRDEGGINGWYFIAKLLGMEAHDLIAEPGEGYYDLERLWPVMFGPVYAVKLQQSIWISKENLA